MSVQVDDAGAESAAGGRSQAQTIKSDKLKRAQRIHALGILVLPLAGTVAALWRAVDRGGVAWYEVGLLALFYVATYLGITVGYHRLFSHRAFRAGRGIKTALGILGSMAWQGPVVYWATNHRLHHTASDQAGDPHSPHVRDEERLSGLRGFWHAHVGWTFTHDVTNPFLFSRDMMRDPDVLFVNRNYYVWATAGIVLPGVLGWIAAGGLDGLVGGILWGAFVRVFLTYHFTHAINSITHLFGSRPFGTRNLSTNSALLALPTCGESWHNNHHAFPASARFGLAWWQVDIGYWTIAALERLGLVSDVKRPAPESIRAKRREAGA